MTPKHFHAYPQEKFGDNKGVTRSSKLKKNRQYKKKRKRQTVLIKTPNRKLKIEQHEPTKTEMNSGVLVG
jgi:hypothetical protein